MFTRISPTDESSYKWYAAFSDLRAADWAPKFAPQDEKFADSTQRERIYGQKHLIAPSPETGNLIFYRNSAYLGAQPAALRNKYKVSIRVTRTHHAI